ncbi:MAG: hypothetical protein ACQERD_05375, partial [Campylobacterota bacterium]
EEFFYVNSIAHTCINFSNSKISFIFDEIDKNIKCYGLDVDDNILLSKQEYELIDSEDRVKLYEFLNHAQEFLNHLEVNQDFDNIKEFESLYEDNHIQSAKFIINFKENKWQEKLLYSDSHNNNPPSTEAYRVCKGNKCFYFFQFTDYYDCELIVKYNDDVKDEVEDFFYKAKENRNILYTVWLIIFLLALISFVFFY